ncbi:hypothetical protein GCM10023214_59160 [Amycolatopsis dongchuanensis]|uniref:Uncharacterized protein n=1 Tax=Amycolatopsis dongchuanensis TaxID=1070866 RepID=A0ABP8VC91_9PSEU
MTVRLRNHCPSTDSAPACGKRMSLPEMVPSLLGRLHRFTSDIRRPGNLRQSTTTGPLLLSKQLRCSTDAVRDAPGFTGPAIPNRQQDGTE